MYNVYVNKILGVIQYMKILKLKDNEQLINVSAIPLDKIDVCGFWLYSAYLYNYSNNTKQLVVVALKDRKMYFVGNLISYSWENIQKVVDKFIIDYVVDLAKEKAIYRGTKIKGFKKCIKIGKEKIYIKNIENYDNFVLMLKHDYVAFKSNVLNHIKDLNN